jgi:hypothetical protein
LSGDGQQPRHLLFSTQIHTQAERHEQDRHVVLGGQLPRKSFSKQVQCKKTVLEQVAYKTRDDLIMKLAACNSALPQQTFS